MLKIKLVHKGLLLVAVPLIFGIAYMGLLCYGLSEANRIVQRELRLKGAMVNYVQVVRNTATTRVCMMCYLFGHKQRFKDYYQSNKKKVIAANNRLHKLLENEPNLKIPELQISSREMLFSGNANLALGIASNNPFMHQLEAISASQTKAALDAMKSLQSLVIGGLILGVLVSAALARYFCLNITNRLLIILANAVSLSRGSSPMPPLAGGDEIAELDELLYKSAMEIGELERFKREMIGVVSHELKSPLSSVGAFLLSLGSGVYGEMTQKAKDKIERTSASVTRLMGLVKELLYLDRLELEMNPETTSVSEIVSMAMDSVKELSEKYEIEIVIKDSAGKVIADRDRLVQVTVNLLSNALKFSPPNGKVTIETVEQNGLVEFRISDQGRGIPEAFRTQIFDPFKQVDAKDATTKKGTGLGLTICRSIVEQHGGVIGVDSEEGHGSTFWFKVRCSGPPLTGLRTPATEQAATDNEKTKSLLTQTKKALPSVNDKSLGMGKFKVLQQGLVIISVPLVFQFIFAGVVAHMLNDVRDQVHKEEKSKDILSSLNHLAETVTFGANMAINYQMTRNPELLASVKSGEKEVLKTFDRVYALCADNPAQLKDLAGVKEVVLNIIAQVSNEPAPDKSVAAYNEMAEMQDPSYERGELDNLKNIGNTIGVHSEDSRRQRLEKGDGGSGGGISGEHRDMGGWDEHRGMGGRGQHRGRGGWGQHRGRGRGEGGMGGMPGGIGMMSKFMSSMQDMSAIAEKTVEPLLGAEDAQDRVMAREEAAGKKLAEIHEKMIRDLELTLVGGIAINATLSIFLALFLLRSLKNRLQHVMENTARLVKREDMDPPKPGSDEIAYLDRVLFESGNHLIELEKFKQELISIVSHELRTPLLSVSSALELFGYGQYGVLSDKGNSRLRFAQNEAGRLIRLINDLLDIEKMEAGKFVLDITEVRLEEPVKQCMAAVAQLAESDDIKLEPIIVNPDLRIWVDRDRFCQVLINLLSNAIKYSPKNSTIKITTELIGEGNNQIKFCVIDQGRGIPAELKQRIFDRFIQVEKSDETERGGTGLGLAISKTIVEQHGGTIGVESEIGSGSTFWFMLPVHTKTDGNPVSIKVPR